MLEIKGISRIGNNPFFDVEYASDEDEDAIMHSNQ